MAQSKFDRGYRRGGHNRHVERYVRDMDAFDASETVRVVESNGALVLIEGEAGPFEYICRAELRA